MIADSEGNQYESETDFIMRKTAEFSEKNKAAPVKENKYNPTVFFSGKEGDMPADESNPAYKQWIQPKVDFFKNLQGIFSGQIKPDDPRYMDVVNTTAMNAVFPIANNPGTLGSFMGVRSKSFDTKKLQMAQKMESDGLPGDVIWQQTGTFKGADGRWRQEISDHDAKLKTDQLGIYEYSPVTSDKKPDWTSIDTRSGDAIRETRFLKEVYWLDEILDHPELFKAYPEMKDVRIAPLSEKYVKDNPGVSAAYDRDQNVIFLRQGLDPDYIRTVLLHEGQHGVQKLEGFARGGNASMFPELSKKEAEEMYKSIKGEVEAYNVNRRQDMKPSERRVTPPQSTESHPRDKQIDAPDGGISNMAGPVSDPWPTGYLDKVPQEQRLSNKGISHPGYRWEVYDKQTGNVVRKDLTTRTGASRAQDRLDNQYGGYRYGVRSVYAKELTEAEKTFLKDNDITIPSRNQ